jgi:spermidine synthase
LRLAAAAALFLLSGFAALLDQVIWQRLLGIFSGVHSYSVTVIVTAFMAGLGFGSLVGGRYADRLSPRRALLGFAACEASIGVFALVSPWLYYDLAYLRLGALARHALALPLVHLLLLLAPTFLMGASLPLLARGLVSEPRSAARSLGLLYGVNTFGAGVGAFASVWYLVGEFGFAGTLRLGSLLNLLAAAGALALARRVPEQAPAAAEPAASGSLAAPAAGLLRWSLVYGLAGFVALSYELLWFRTLDVMIKSSPYTFGHLLGFFLCSVGAGSLLGAWLAPRSRAPERAFFWSQWGISATAGLSMAALVHSPSGGWLLRSLHRYWESPDGLEKWHVLERQALSLYVLLPLAMFALPAALMGLSFAYLQRVVQTRIGELGWRVGVIQTSNIVGCMMGSLMTGAALLSLLGTPRSLALLLASGALFGWWAAKGWPGRLAAVAASLASALAVPAPSAFWARLHGRAPGDIVAAEDATGIAAAPLGEHTTMRVNGRGHSHMPYGGIHTLLGAIPALLRSDVQDALIVGMGSGSTAWAAGSAEAVRRIEVYEIVRPELTVLQELLRRSPVPRFRDLRGFLSDPRVRLAFTDGRLALRNSERRFDLIEADGLEPSMAYSGNLYSREFFELVRSRLKPGGFLCSYVPTARTARTVAAVFPHTLDFHCAGLARFVMASEAPLRFELEAVRERLRSPWTQAYFDRAGQNPQATALIEDFLARAQVGELRRDAGDVNTDLFPRDEFGKP